MLDIGPSFAFLLGFGVSRLNLYLGDTEMAQNKKAIGKLTNQLAEALDDLALAVENFRINERRDAKVVQAFNVSQAAISKAQKSTSD